MAKEATLQVRMDAQLKESVEILYREMGTSFAEAVRIFAKQSVMENGMPFIMKSNTGNSYGRLAEYAKLSTIYEEKIAFQNAMVKKHEQID